MKTRLVLILIATVTSLAAQTPDYSRQARNITIVRDDWGIAHIYGKTDADCVFGALYTQAEDDFNRVETNYINAMGRLAEAEGESKIYQDLRMKLFISPDDLKKQYAASPAWLQTLMNAWADGLNFYLLKHPDVTPRVIKHFEPWMALSFTEGSIGGDIERVRLNALEALYGGTHIAKLEAPRDAEPSGSNGMAVAPANTATHHAMLLINPHTSFFFRSELQMVSEEGLNNYGAVTWGQFFIYQGFNDRIGWMHTSSAVNAVTEYLETVVKKGDRYFYKFGSEERPMIASEIAVPYKTAAGMAEKKFVVYRTHHGPIVREANGKWVSYRIMREPVKALMQSFLRTKAKDYKAYLKTMDLQANSSNNTIFADADGDIAYFDGNFIPRRDARFDWRQPVDGSDPATEWQGLLSVDETPHLLNPKSGWIYNSNDWPWAAAGPSSPKKEDYPPYIENGIESARGRHAVRVLQNGKEFTLNSFLAAAFDSYLPWFEKPLPALLKAWDEAPADSRAKTRVADQVKLLRAWDMRWSATSVPTTLAVFWGQEFQRPGRGAARANPRPAGMSQEEYVASRPADELLNALVSSSDRIAADFGTWKTPWGDINRFQRISPDITPHFDDAGPSIPVPFTSAVWGSLASFGAGPYPGTKKWYGNSGNSFVAVVEFGDKVHARAVTAGGESGNPKSPHFNDEATRYATGDLREVYFYREQLKGHTEREYHPGQPAGN